MKYIFLAIVFLFIGYGISLFISPADLGIDKIVAGLGLNEPLDSVRNSEAKPISEEDSNAQLQSNPEYPKGSYLTGSDLLSTPGITKPLGFRVGPPVSSEKAESIINSLSKKLTLSKARYLTGNNKQAVIVIANSYEDYLAASKDKNSLQPMLKETLEIIYLPECVQANSPDDEGYICGLPEQENSPN